MFIRARFVFMLVITATILVFAAQSACLAQQPTSGWTEQGKQDLLKKVFLDEVKSALAGGEIIVNTGKWVIDPLVAASTTEGTISDKRDAWVAALGQAGVKTVWPAYSIILSAGKIVIGGSLYTVEQMLEAAHDQQIQAIITGKGTGGVLDRVNNVMAETPFVNLPLVRNQGITADNLGRKVQSEAELRKLWFRSYGSQLNMYGQNNATAALNEGWPYLLKMWQAQRAEAGLDDLVSKLNQAMKTAQNKVSRGDAPGGSVGGASDKWMWIRGKPEVTGFGDPSTTHSTIWLNYNGVGPNGQPASNTLTWRQPPGRLRDGNMVTLNMSCASPTPGATVGGWYNIGDMSSSKDPTPQGSLNGAGSADNWRLPESGGSPHEGTLKFTFRPGAKPWVQVSAGHEPNTGTWGLITWKYTRVPDDGKPQDAPMPDDISGSQNATSTPGESPSAARSTSGGGNSGALDFSGKWNTTWGDWWGIELRQEGNRVTGTYFGGSATLEGTIQGRVLRLKWTEANGKSWGGAKFTLSDDGKSMKGSRNDWGDPDKVQYRWDLARP